MQILANTAIFLVALIHIYILILEMFLWCKPSGLKAFRLTPEKAEITKVLAANQGLYNGFLAAGLLWGLYTNNLSFKVFFLLCVITAGTYGAITVNRKVALIQALPAAVALLLLSI